MDFLYTLIIYPLYTIIEVAYTLVDKITHNEGISVIGVSVAITLLCLPLYAVAEHWQEVEREKQDKMKSGLDRIKKAFSGDERYMMTTTFYRQHRYNPIMALRSSFGLLIQIPFFLAAYAFLSHLPDLQGVKFLFIRDMGNPDALFSIGSFTVNILPIAMTLINCTSGIIYSKGHGIREKIQIFVMAAVFLVVLYNSPAGLVLYWTFNNIFSLVKNVFYKLRNPLKSFWIFGCIACTLMLLFVLFGFKTKAAYKAIFAALVAIVYLLPLILSLVRKIFHNLLIPLFEHNKTRSTIYLLSCVLLFILSGLTIPTSLIASSPIEFSGIGSSPNPLGYVSLTVMQAAGFFIFWPVCVYFLFNKKVQSVLTLFMAFLSISALLNSFVFMLGYGDISATLTFLNSVNFKTVSFVSFLNLILLALVFVLVTLTISKKEGKIFSYSFAIITFAMIALGVMNISTIKKEYKAFVANGNLNEVDIEPIFHLSKNARNVVLFMLDRAESQYVEEMFKEASEFNDIFTGFTFYPNTVSFNGHTMMGAPLIYGGYEYQPLEMNKLKDELLYKKTNEALLLLPRIFTEQADFHATITDPSWSNYSAYADLSITDDYPKIDGYQTIGKYSTAWYKQHSNGESLDNTDALLKHNLIIFSIFRESPVILREMIYLKGKYWNSNGNLTSFTNVINNYAPLDFLTELTDISESEEGSYICMVNELTHSSIYMQAPDYKPVQNVTDYGSSVFSKEEAYHTNISAFKRLASWINFLKENDIYDNTRIILVADHSRATSESCIEENIDLDNKIAGDNYRGRGHFHPLLMMKDFGATGELKEDMTFMTNGDVPSLALKGIVENPVNPFTGKSIPLDTSEIKKDGVIVTSNDVHQAWLYKNLYTYPIRKDQWWRVKDSIFKASSWSQEIVED
ncbi:MAG: membrane protein insertase YidC [Treponema sp.]|uniref:membrane protein insertase YidC n=1 Tax=Treponema sp. TaxID=166 RepID=UPI0025FF9711|nr:membrane protein insertase YidC [Treponema sp.]MBQ9281260.1 membrane protein insertase YidC [Treponema sp.]